MSKKRNNDKGQLRLDFNFNFEGTSQSSSVEGGSQEQLSDFEFGLRSILKSCLDKCAKRKDDALDRYEVAARMSRKIGREITKSHIDQWSAMSTIQRRIHVDTLKALCEVIGDYAPLHYLVESCGFKALHPEEAQAAEYGSKMLFKRMIEADLKDTLNGIDEDELRRRLINRILGAKS